LLWESAGIILIVVLGSVLHFAFEWSRRWTPVAMIAAVNESVWEYLKLGFWLALAYAILGYCLISPFCIVPRFALTATNACTTHRFD